VGQLDPATISVGNIRDAMPSNSRTRATPHRIALAERERDALELRKAGKTFDEIAETLGYSERGSASKAVSRALAATIQHLADGAARP
jgi:DNA-binding NarL/FixJ family response regulator